MKRTVRVAAWLAFAALCTGITCGMTGTVTPLFLTAGMLVYGLLWCPLALLPASQPLTVPTASRYETVTVNGRLFIYDRVSGYVIGGGEL